MSALASSPYAVDPFGPSANPAAYVPLASSERARSTLERSLDDGRVAALLGPPGLGKTVILHLVRARRAERAAAVYVPFCNLEPDELFALALNGLGEHPEDAPPREVLLALARGCADRGGILLLVDDAAAMPTAAAEALAELLLAAGGGLGLALAAVEGPEARRVCGAFGTRVDVVRLAEGMSEPETRRYLEARLAWAGARPDLVAAFDDETVAELHRESDGVPRRVNQRAHDLVRRVAPTALPRLAEALGQLARTPAPESPIAGAPLVLPPSEPPPRALLERDARREAGGYRLARGRPVEPVPEPPPALPVSRAAERPAEAPEPRPHAAETPGDVFARLKRPAPPAPSAPPTDKTSTAPAGRVAEARRKPTRAAAPAPVPRRARLFAGAAVFAFVSALAFAWASGRIAPDMLPSLGALEAVAGLVGAASGFEGASEEAAAPGPPTAETTAATALSQATPTAPAPEEPASARAPAPVVADTAPATSPETAPGPPGALARSAEPGSAPAPPSASRRGPSEPEPLAAATPEPVVGETREAARGGSEPGPGAAPARSAPSGPSGMAAAERTAKPTIPSFPALERRLEPAAPTARAPRTVPPPAPRTPAPDPPAAVADLVPVAINAIPWAEVSVDGRELGETPLARIRLAPGPHTFRARMPDGTTREQTLEITPERRTVVFE